MNNVPRQHSPEEIHTIFSRLNPRDVEQFYRNYQLWLMQQQISSLETRIMGLQQQIVENDTHLQQLHPSPIALAALAQLQANGVNDIDLLDRMLERGETWLDQTMQRLAYCEKFEFISDNYTEWCKHALEGAYDWIDSVQDSSSPASLDEEVVPTETPVVSMDNAPAEEITEEMLLEKLMSDEADEADSWQETTLKRPSVKLAQTEETTTPHSAEVPDAAMEEAKSSEINQPPAPLPEEPVPAEMDASATILAAEISQVETNTGAEQAAASVVPSLGEQTQDTLAAAPVEGIQDIAADSRVEAQPDITKYPSDEENQEAPEPIPTERERNASSSDKLAAVAEDRPLVETAPFAPSRIVTAPTDYSTIAEQIESTPTQADSSIEQVQSSDMQGHKDSEEPGIIETAQETQESIDGIFIESAPEDAHADEPTDFAGTGEEVILTENSEGTGAEADTVSGPTQGRLSIEQQNTTPVSTQEEHAAVEIPTDERIPDRSYQGEPPLQRKRGFFQRIFSIFRSH